MGGKNESPRPAVRSASPGELRYIHGEGDPSVTQVRAAAMLHTDTADALWPTDVGLALSHIEMARHWARFSETYLEETWNGSRFRRRWTLAAGLLLVERGAYEGSIEPAREYFDRASEDLSDDIPILTASAWLEQRVALAAVPIASAGPVPLHNSGRGRLPSVPGRTGPVPAKQRFLASAAERVTSALEQDPDAVAPALRLGRIRTIQGRKDDGRQVLEVLVSRVSLSSADAYLAQLFLGRLLETENDLTRAADLYSDAIALLPGPRSARMALAQLRYAAGDARAAADLLEASLERGPLELDSDPWAEYLGAYLDLGPILRDELRAEPAP